ncbi:arginase family protein [Oceanobacillus senegalensis]|uniref:arginase family protein n=1 Tax=Oceanobacillus senegalensis TaxID=1936063 RepID=UPI000A308890|nr:arginase family protein [Oceanobacillus senegalensis]
MQGNIALLNLDGSYNHQSFYQGKPYEWIDLESIPSTSLFCEKSTLRSIYEKLHERWRSSITFLGSGNYHYISYLLQSRIEKPYTLVLFDHHTDTLPSPSDTLISCGSWVLESLKQFPLLKKVFIIGVSEEAKHHIPDSFYRKVVTYTENSLHTDYLSITKSILKNIPTDSVYISIDKDVLDKKEAVTGWDHGTLKLKQMMRMVRALFKWKEINGVDICGEYPINPTNKYQKQAQDALAKNDSANGFILRQIREGMKAKYKSIQLLNYL